MSTDVKPVIPPNLPLAPVQYSKAFEDQFASVLRLFFSAVANTVNSPSPYGSYYDTTTQTNPVANVARAMTVNSTSAAWGVSKSNDNSRIYVAASGVYNIQFSVQADKTGGSADPLYIWLRVNGTDVASSASKVVINGPNAEVIPSWNFMIQLASGSYIQIMWSSPDTTMVLANVAASSPVPAIPSVIITVAWVSNVPI